MCSALETDGSRQRFAGLLFTQDRSSIPSWEGDSASAVADSLSPSHAWTHQSRDGGGLAGKRCRLQPQNAVTGGNQDMASGTQQNRFRRELSLTDLTMVTLGGLIGSGWLFAAQSAARYAGPAVIISWVIGGIAVIVLGLTFAELAGMLPEAGGVIRYPHYSHGSFVSFLVGWAALISWAGLPSIEAAAVIQYASSYIPGIYSASQGSLTTLGLVVAFLLVSLFFVINSLGVKFYARVNTPLTFIKIATPVTTAIVLLITSFHPANFTAHGGFMPFGWAGVFSAISAGGIIFTFTGFRPMFDLAAEAKHPQRDIPRAFMLGMLIAGVIYLALQLAFSGAVPAQALAHGWANLSFSSPFANLAVALNLPWLAIVLYGDAILSPSGTSLTYAAAVPRAFYAYSGTGHFPAVFRRLNGRGLPAAGILLSYIVALVFLLPFPSWQKMVGILSSATILTYMIGPVTLAVLRKSAPQLRRPFRLWASSWLGPIAFVIGSMIFYWTGWPTDGILLIATLVGLIMYFYYYARNKTAVADLRRGIWLVVYFVFGILMSYFGSFGGTGVIAAPWDTIIVAVASIGFYYWAVAAGGGEELLAEAHAVAAEAAEHEPSRAGTD